MPDNLVPPLLFIPGLEDWLSGNLASCWCHILTPIVPRRNMTLLLIRDGARKCPEARFKAVTEARHLAANLTDSLAHRSVDKVQRRKNLHGAVSRLSATRNTDQLHGELAAAASSSH